MSEVKGTLLGIVLALSIFSIVFTLITFAVNNAAISVSERIEETGDNDPTVFTEHQSHQTVYLTGI